MSIRYTAKDVRIQLARLTRAAEAVGWDTSLWRVDAGSKTYGRAYRLYRLELPSHAHGTTELGQDFLGMTAAEAFHTLATMARTLESVAYSSPFFCPPVNVVPE